MRKLELCALVCEFAIVTSTLSLDIRIKDSRQTCPLYATFVSDLDDLDQFEHKIAINLTQALLCSKLLPIGSEIRYLVHAYLIDFYQSAGHSQIEDVTGREQIGASKIPICAYRMIRRSFLFLNNLIAHKHFLLKGALGREIIHFVWRNGWPFFKNSILAADKILELQNVYNLEAKKLALGSILDFYTNCSLSSDHSYQIGYIAFKSDQFTLALEWLELAKEKAVVDKMASIVFIERLIWRATDEHNLEFEDKKERLGSNMYNRMIRYIPGDSKRARKVRDIRNEKFKGKRGSSYKQINYRGLCSGENFQTEEEKSYLFCWLEYKLYPSLLIGPLKMEFLSRNPDVVQAYEMILDKELEAILSNSRTRRAGTAFQKLQTGLNSSSKATVSLFDLNRVNIVSQKLKKLSIAVVSSEVEVESFSFGGHYFSSNDQVDFNCSNLRDDRITSYFVVQLIVGDVEKVGLTAFPSLGVAAKPVKGSVVFWYGFYQDGSEDTSTNRAACPVLVGHKWVATNWIRNKNQHIQRCGLNQNKRFIFPVNSQYLPTPTVKVIDMEEHPPPPKFPFQNASKLAKYSYISPRAIKSLVQLEWTIYPQIKHFYNKYRNQTKGTFREEFDRRNQGVKMYLEEFETFTIALIGNLKSIKSADIKTVEKVALNFLASFKIVTRFMDYIQKWVQRKSWTGNMLMMRITSYLANVYNILEGPTKSDFESALFGLYNTQCVHGLDIEDIAKGIVAGINTKVTLNARDCLNVAKYSTVFSDHKSALKWAEHALYLTKNGSDDSVKYEEVYDYFSTFQMDYDCTVQPQNPICHGKTKSTSKGRLDNADISQDMFWSMCKGNTFQTEKEKAELFCWYERETHPSYKIGPIKAEWLSMRPKAEVVYFYDIISDTIMNSLINFTYDNAYRQAYEGDNGESIAHSLERQVMFAWAAPQKNEAAMFASKLAERITGLKIVKDASGPGLRMCGYSPGSFRADHHDTVENMHVATFMFYFNDVQAGGETPFISSGVNVIPRKGSAVFWYNLFTDGNTDESTDHGGCPVIMGEKWSSLRWILYQWQDHLKCDLKPETPFEILVNGKSKYNWRKEYNRVNLK